MPKLIGMSVVKANAALNGYPAKYVDLTGVAVRGTAPGQSMVCQQKPSPGVVLTGQVITVTIAAAGKTC